MDCRIAFATVGERHKLLTFAVESTKKLITRFQAICNKVVSDIVEISAGKDVDDIATHAYT
jgi:hypothetical protein